jgi:hypothetical protein
MTVSPFLSSTHNTNMRLAPIALVFLTSISLVTARSLVDSRQGALAISPDLRAHPDGHAQPPTSPLPDYIQRRAGAHSAHAAAHEDIVHRTTGQGAGQILFSGGQLPAGAGSRSRQLRGRGGRNGPGARGGFQHDYVPLRASSDDLEYPPPHVMNLLPRLMILSSHVLHLVGPHTLHLIHPHPMKHHTLVHIRLLMKA